MVINSVQGGTGAKTYTFDTRTLPNGAYTARAIERNRSGFLYCTSSTKTTNRSVTIDNFTALTMNAPASAPQNTTIAVSARAHRRQRQRTTLGTGRHVLPVR